MGRNRPSRRLAVGIGSTATEPVPLEQLYLKSVSPSPSGFLPLGVVGAVLCSAVPCIVLPATRTIV